MMDATNLFDRFGGTRKMADHLGEPPSTVQSWKKAGRIPAHRQAAVLTKARSLGLAITAEHVLFPAGEAGASDKSDFIALKCDAVSPPTITESSPTVPTVPNLDGEEEPGLPLAGSFAEPELPIAGLLERVA